MLNKNSAWRDSKEKEDSNKTITLKTSAGTAARKDVQSVFLTYVQGNQYRDTKNSYKPRLHACTDLTS